MMIVPMLAREETRAFVLGLQVFQFLESSYIYKRLGALVSKTEANHLLKSFTLPGLKHKPKVEFQKLTVSPLNISSWD